ncbi:hypothetical protein DFH29DRAFT_932261 [Suillus ampliporus]|nr:hypothetical protein DFH29DRAFT_932261 [Suillus ampliporus]
MYQHLGIELNDGTTSAPITPPSTQNATASGSGSNAHSSSSTRPAPSGTRAPAAPRPPAQSGPSQPSASQSTQQPIPQQAHSSSARAAQPAAPNPAPLAAQPAAVPPAPAQPQAIPAPADEIAALRARIAELERGNAHGNHFPARAPVPQQALVADPTEIDRIRTNLAGAKDEPKWLILPALQPGHKVSALSLPIPPKVEEAFKNYRYVPYTALTHTARSKAFLRGEDSSFVFTQDGLTAKGLDCANELSIMMVDWIAAAKAAEDRTLHYWGEARASALVSHHLVVLNIGHTHGWPVAMHYDVQQRELAHANHEHNLAGLNVAALTIANNKIPPAAPQSTPFISPSKRAAPSDFQTSPHKKSHALASSHCFCCGSSGHLPADCTADTTAAEKPVASLATNARSKHTLATSNGKHYCFNWANGSNCTFSPNCRNVHACSICGDSSRSASSCKARG